MRTAGSTGFRLRGWRAALALAVLASACGHSLALSGRGAAFWFGQGWGCGGDGDRPGIDAILGEARRWFHVEAASAEEIERSVRPGTALVDVGLPLAAVGREGEEGEATSRTLSFFPAVLPGVEWGVLAGAETFLPVGSTGSRENVVWYGLVRHPDGFHFIVGECGYHITRILQQGLGDEYDAALRELPGTVDLEEILDLLGLAPPDPGPPGPTILAPGDADPDLLRRLRDVSVSIDVPSTWRGPYFLCTKIREGWNECMDLAFEHPDPVELVAYLGDDRRLELWLLDERGDLRSPVQRLAELDVSEAAVGPITSGTLLRIEVHGAFTGVDPPAVDPLATVTVIER